MSKFDIQLDMSPTQQNLDELMAGINEHSAEFVDKPGFKPVALFSRDDDGRLRGGIYGRVNWTWLDVSLLWVSPDERGSGLGTALLERLESEARNLGCTRTQVDTFSFQAKAFYLANGYAVFAELEDYPAGHSRIYLRKTL